MLTVKGSDGGEACSTSTKIVVGRGRRVSINILPDDVLLDIFDHYMPQRYPYYHHKLTVEAWHKLVHVCQRWRYLVFDSPRRLNLQLLCTNETPVTNMLHIWPALPIIIAIYTGYPLSANGVGVTNIISALQQHNRVWSIDLRNVPNSLFKEFATMQGPFPALTNLDLLSYDENVPVLPDSFLGGSAPRLQVLRLLGIPFPGLPKLLLSTHDLVTLRLDRIPPSGYISPDAMVTCLSTLTSLEKLELRFRTPRSQADRASRRPPPLTLVALPALTSLQFTGDSEYLEDIMFPIEAPLLSSIDVKFFYQLIFDTPRLRHFISRTAISMAANKAYIWREPDFVQFQLGSLNSIYTKEGSVRLWISCQPLDSQISSLAQVCSASFPPLPTLESLNIHMKPNHNLELVVDWQDNMEDTQWLDLLRPFTSVKNLALSRSSVALIAPALQELSGERVTEVLPSLENLHLQESLPSGPVKEAIGKFTAARQLSGCPITVLHDYQV